MNFDEIKEKLVEIKDRVVEFFQGIKLPDLSFSANSDGRKVKYRVKWGVAIPLFICVVLILYLLISLIVGLAHPKQPAEMNIYSIGDLTGRQTYEIIMAEDRTEGIEVKDYNFYGESLNMYFSKYTVDISNANTLKGKKVVFKNLLADESIEFDCSDKVDDQIILSKLKPGFYSVYIPSGEVNKRVYMTAQLTTNNIFRTVTRNGHYLEIELIANSKLFDEEGQEVSTLDKNYLYVKVTDHEAAIVPKAEYDVVISTSPALTVTGVSLVGLEDNGVVQAEEMYQVAEKVAEKLTAAGLKVKILKSTYDENILFYGPNGTLNQAYNAKAKYMIHLDMSDEDDYYTIYSCHTKGSFAKSVFSKIRSDADIYGSDEYLIESPTWEDGVSDYVYPIREAGGVVLNAGKILQAASDNVTFAAKNIFGINTIYIETANIHNAENVDQWVQNKTKVAEAIAQGIIDYLK